MGNNILEEIIHQKQDFILMGEEKEIAKWKEKLNLQWLQNMNAVQIYQITF